MHRLILISLCALVAFTGCASHSRFNLDIPLSQASSMATETSVESRSISSNTRSSFYSHTTLTRSASFFAPFDPYWYGPYDHRLLIARQAALNVGVSRYNLLNGYSVSYAARTDEQEFHFSVFFADSEFQSLEATAGLTDPFLFGLNVDWHRLFPTGSMALVLGGRISFSQLAFGYENDLVVDGVGVAADAIGVFGIGMPMGIQWDASPFTFEALAVPTLYFHDDVTVIGFVNDIVTLNATTPLSFGIGFVF